MGLEDITEVAEVTETPPTAQSSDVIPIEEFENGGIPGGDTSPTEETSGDPAVAAAPEPEPAASWQGVRDAAAGFGVQFPETVADDHAALRYLIEQGRQQQLHAELGRQLAPKAPQIRQYLEQQAAPPPPAKQPWDEPEGFNPQFLSLVEFQPEAGVFIGKSPMVPQAIVDKVNEYSEWKRRLDDPKVREGHISHLADQRVKAALDARFGEYREQMELQQIEAQNAPFLYEKDEAGRLRVGMDGRPALSIPGARYLALVQEVQQSGVAGIRNIDALARRLLAGEVALAQRNGQQVASSPAQRTAQQAVGRPNRNPLQSLPAVERRETPAATEPLGPSSLMSRMLRDLDDAGTTDADFALSTAG